MPVENTDKAPDGGEMPKGSAGSEKPPVGQDQPSELDELRTELAQARAALKSANSEAAERRRKLDKYEEEAEKRRQDELSEAEKAQERIQELERVNAQQATAQQDYLMKMEMRLQAAQMNFIDPDEAYVLSDKEGVSVDDDGKVTGIAEALQALAEKKPHLLDATKPRPVAPDTGGGRGNTPDRAGGVSLTTDERDIARKTGMGEDEYMKLKQQRAGLYFTPPKE